MGGVPLKSPSGRRPGKVARRSKSRGPQAGAEVLSNRCSANLWLQAIPSRTLFATVRAISPPPPVRGLRRQWRINGSAAQPATSHAEAETALESRRVALQPDTPTAVAQADVLECGAATWPAVSTVARRAYVRTARCAAHGVASGGTGERVGRAAALSVALEAAVQTDVSLAAGHGGHSQSVGATVLESRRVAVQPDAPTAIALADVLVARHHGRQHRRWRGRRMYGRCAAQHMEWPVAALAHGSAGQPRSHSHRRQRSSQT